MENVIKAGDLVRVTTEEGDIGVGFAYEAVDGVPDSGLLIDLSWSYGGSSECISIDKLSEVGESLVTEKVMLAKLSRIYLN
jgi:hypothetical protein